MSRPGYSPYVNRSLRVNDRVRVDCPVSRYHGERGTVFEVNEVTGYAIVALLAGTEMRVEKIGQNKILAGWKAETKKPKRRPDGDPQYFPVGWLVTIGVAP
jgi:hypothetical protein